MGTPRIKWLGGGATVDWPEPISVPADFVWRHPPRKLIGQHTSHGSVTETVALAHYDEIDIRHERFTSRSFFRDLVAFSSGAMNGEQFSFALDRDKIVDAQITIWANPMRVNVTTGTILASSTEYRILSADRTRWAYVQATVVAFVSGTLWDVTVAALPAAGFAAGDIFRDPYYFPNLMMLNPESNPVVEHAGIEHSFAMRAREDRS